MTAEPLCAFVRGPGGGDPIVGRVKGLTTFEPIGDQTVFSGVGLEDTTALDEYFARNRVVELLDRTFFYHKNVIYALNKATDAWVSVYTVSDQNTANAFATHGGFTFWSNADTGEFGFVAPYRTSGGNNMGFVRYRYGADTFDTFDSGTTAENFSYHSAAFFRGSFYVHAANSTTPQTFAFNPTSTAITVLSMPAGADVKNAEILVASGQLYSIVNGLGFVRIHELTGGAFTTLATQSGLGNDTVITESGRLMVLYNATNDAIVFATCNAAETAAVQYSFDLTTNLFTDRSSGLPGALSSANATGTDERAWRFTTWRDSDDAAGSHQAYICFQSGFGIEGVALYAYNEATDAWTAVGAFVGGAYSLPWYPYGGGVGTKGNGQLSALITAAAAAPGALDLTLRLAGDPTVVRFSSPSGTFQEGETVTGGTSSATGVVLPAGVGSDVIRLGSVTGTFSVGETITGGTSSATGAVDGVLAISTPTGTFSVGETITGGTSSATGVVTEYDTLNGLVKYSPTSGTFQNAETITGGTSGATATTSAAPAASDGGGADYELRLFYDTGENYTEDQATLGTPGAGFVGSSTVTSNGLRNVAADGLTEWRVRHETDTDGIAAGANLRYMKYFGPNGF